MMEAWIHLFDIRTAAVARTASATVVKGGAGHARNEQKAAGNEGSLTFARIVMVGHPPQFFPTLAQAIVNPLNYRGCECGSLRG